MKLSIIVVNLNTVDLTRECFNSIYKNKPNFSFEIIAVDNGSNDGSVEMIKEYANKHKNFHFILNDSNTGYAKANNQGIRKAIGKYILLLNNDTLVYKKSLEILVKEASRLKDAGVLGSKLLNYDGSLQMSCFNFPTIKNAIIHYFVPHGKKLLNKFAPLVDSTTAVDSVVGAVFLITPKAKKRVGLLDEKYFAYFEDIDYCRQVWKQGMKVYYVPKSVILHYHGATFKKLANESERWKKLIPSSKLYHGFFTHYIINLIIWLGQKYEKIKNLLGIRS